MFNNKETFQRLLRLLNLSLLTTLAVVAHGQSSQTQIVRQTQDKIVKVYGAGGLRGLEAYQSGFLISPAGHIATVWSYVLDVDPVVILNDGRRFESEVVGFEPTLELCVLKIDAEALPYFSVQDLREPEVGEPVLAYSNLFGIATGNEPASVMQGYIAGRTDLDARRGVFKSSYTGEVYVLDLIANNPGAAGGALADRDGNLLGMLGKELRDGRSGAWLNYALPTSALKSRMYDIVTGKVTVAAVTKKKLSADMAHNSKTLGIVLVPDVLDKTPAYVDAVAAGSPAESQKIQPDDLVLLVGGQRVDSQQTLRELLGNIDRRDPVTLTLQRGIEIVTLTLEP